MSLQLFLAFCVCCSFFAVTYLLHGDGSIMKWSHSKPVTTIQFNKMTRQIRKCSDKLSGHSSFLNYDSGKGWPSPAVKVYQARSTNGAHLAPTAVPLFGLTSAGR